jgi:hypothetical protein
MNSRSSSIPKFIRGIFSFFARPHQPYTPSEWGQLALVAYAFVISLAPPPQVVSPLPITTDYQPLILSSLLLSQRLGPSVDLTPSYMEIYSLLPQELTRHLGITSFYARTPVYFYTQLPTYLEKELNSAQFQAATQNFFSALGNLICDVSPGESVKYDYVVFASEIFKFIKSFRPIPDEFHMAFDVLLRIAGISPSMFLCNFFFPWYYFVQKSHDSKKPSVFKDQIETVTRLIEASALLKYHECHRQFSWYLCFYFFDFVQSEAQQERILAFICSGIRRVFRMDVFTCIPDAISRFAHHRMLGFDDRPWPIYYMMTSQSSSIGSLVRDLDRIVGAARVGFYSASPVLYEKVSFASQSGSSFSLDSELYTIFPCRVYPTIEELLKAFEKYVQIADSLKKRLTSAAFFQFHFAMKLGKQLEGEQRPEEVTREARISSILHYLLNMFRNWSRLMILVGHRQYLLTTYSQPEVLSSSKIPRNLELTTASPKRLLEMTPVFRSFFDLILGFPSEFRFLFAREIVEEMFKSIKKEQLTYTFMNYFQLIQNDTGHGGEYRQSFLANILSRMMEVAAAHTHLIVSNSVKDSTLIYSWLLFTIRFGSAQNHDHRNPVLGIYLTIYESLFTNAIFFNTKRIANQSLALKTIAIYLHTIKRHAPKTQDAQVANQQKQRNRPKALLFDDFHDSAQLDAIGTIMTVFLERRSLLSVSQLLPFLDAAFRSGNRSLMATAAKICLQKLTPQKVQKHASDWDFDMSPQLFDSFFNVMAQTPMELSIDILKRVPEFATWFLSLDTTSPIPTRSQKIAHLDFDMYLILKAISSHWTDSKEALSAVFILISICFVEVLHTIDQQPVGLKRILKTLVQLLCHCWCYDFLTNQLHRFSSVLIMKFGVAFIQHGSNGFVLTLLDVAGSGRSRISKTALDLAKAFFEYLRGKPFDKEVMTTTVSQLLLSFAPHTRLFSILTGFSLIMRFFPESFELRHLRSFLVQTTDVFPVDVKFTTVLNRLLKEYLVLLDQRELEQFVQMVYEIICPLAVGVRIVLIRRIAKLGVPLPFRSLDEIERTPNVILWHQRLSLAFLCGLREPIFISGPLRNEINEMMATRSENGIRLDQHSRVLSMLFTILNNRVVFMSFIQDHDLPQPFYAVLFNSLASRIPPIKSLAKKCFTKLKTKYFDECRLAKHFDDISRSPERIVKFLGQLPDRVGFYVRLTKICPERITPAAIKTFFRALSEYATKSDYDKIQGLCWLGAILKAFTVRSHLSLPKVREQVLEGSPPTSLHSYILVILQLFEHNEIPFMTFSRKYIIKFLIQFAKEMMELVLTTDFPISIFSFLEDLIVHDQSLTFFDEFLDGLSNVSKYLELRPGFFALLERLAGRERFASRRKFWDVCEKVFSILLMTADYQRRGASYFPILSHVAASLIGVFRFVYDLDRVRVVAKILRIPFFNRSDVVRDFLKFVCKESPVEFQEQLLRRLVQQFSKFPALILKSLFPKTIKSIKRDLHFLWEYVPGWFQSAEAQVAVVRGITELLKKSKPTKEGMIAISSSVKRLITSTDPELCIYSLKLCTILAELRHLHPQVYYAILRQMFSYHKFSEPPFISCFLKFLRVRPDLLENIPADDVNFFVTFFQDRFADWHLITKLISPMNCVFYAAPSLLKLLPFSVVAAIATCLDNMISKAGPDDNTRDVTDLLHSLTTFCQVMKVPREEANIYAKIYYKFLKQQPTSTDFFTAALNLDIGLFPSEFIQELTKINDHIGFSWVCVATKINADFVIKQHRDLIEKVFLYVQDENSRVVMPLFDVFLRSVFQDATGLQLFGKTLKQTFDILVSDPRCWDRLFSIAQVLIEYRIFYCLPQLWEIMGNLGQPDARPLLSFLARALEFVETPNQLSYTELLFGNPEISRDFVSVLTSLIPGILRSPKVTNASKSYILEHMIELLVMNQEFETDNLIKAVRELPEHSFYVPPILIQLHLLQAEHATGFLCLVCLEKILQLLPEKAEERILYMFEYIPIILWQDRFIPFLVSLVVPQCPIWQPIFAVSRRLVNVGVELVSISFQKLLTDDTIPAFRGFLARLLKHHNKLKHIELISGLIRMFYLANVKIPTDLAQKAIRYSNNCHLLEFFLTPGDLPIDTFLSAFDERFLVCKLPQ